jgi:hypothetical protein
MHLRRQQAFFDNNGLGAHRREFFPQSGAVAAGAGQSVAGIDPLFPVTGHFLGQVYGNLQVTGDLAKTRGPQPAGGHPVVVPLARHVTDDTASRGAVEAR